MNTRKIVAARVTGMLASRGDCFSGHDMATQAADVYRELTANIVAHVVRNEAGQIYMIGPDDEPFNPSKYVGKTLVVLP